MPKKTISLNDFTHKVATLWEAGKIKAPVHLSGGNEKELTEIFHKHYRKGDWICSTHRSHYHWLLAGHSEKELLDQILEGRSMHIFGERFITSAIVGGIAPIAVGLAMGLKMNGSKNKVLCFIGDAAAHCGVVMESIRYSVGHNLPILFVIEDNAMSVRANTLETWGLGFERKDIEYFYDREYPHAGTDKYVMF